MDSFSVLRLSFLRKMETVKWSVQFFFVVMHGQILFCPVIGEEICLLCVQQCLCNTKLENKKQRTNKYMD